jgi:phospholipase/lecithinase/hemolysin
MHHKVSRLILLMTAAMAPCAMAQNQPATGRIVFGDSLSDTGNVYRVIGQPPVIAGRPVQTPGATRMVRCGSI